MLESAGLRASLRAASQAFCSPDPSPSVLLRRLLQQSPDYGCRKTYDRTKSCESRLDQIRVCVGQSDVVLRHGPVERPHRQLWKMTMTSPHRRYDGEASPTTTTSFPPIPPQFLIVTELLEVVRCRRSQQRSSPSFIAQAKRSHARLHLQWRGADGRIGRRRRIVDDVRYLKGGSS